MGYSAAEGKAFISLVDLLLRLLKRAEELPPAGLLPENVESALAEVEEAVGPGAASRLRVFLSKCIAELKLKTSPSAKQWIPFKKRALYQADNWDEPKAHLVAVFYFVVSGRKQTLSFPINYYYTGIKGFNTDRVIEELTELGSYPSGASQNLTIDLQISNDQAFFDALFDTVSWITEELHASLQDIDTD